MRGTVAERARVEALATALGYRRIASFSNLVFVHDARGEILKVAPTSDPEWVEYKRADFARCLRVSAIYAEQGLMPKVLEVGPDFQGTGFPFLREQYVPGENLSRAYLSDPASWGAVLAAEIRRIYRTISSGVPHDARQGVAEKLRWLPSVAGYEAAEAMVRQSGDYLLQHHPLGYQVHGDLQFGNLVASRDGGSTPRLTPIDWELTEVLPLGCEFAHFYVFLHDPVPQVDHDLRAAYAARRPLREVWASVAPVIRHDLGVSLAEFEHSLRFRMGNAWLNALAEAQAGGDRAAASYRSRWLHALVSGALLDALPYPDA